MNSYFFMIVRKDDFMQKGFLAENLMPENRRRIICSGANSARGVLVQELDKQEDLCMGWAFVGEHWCGRLSALVIGGAGLPAISHDRSDTPRYLTKIRSNFSKRVPDSELPKYQLP